MLKPIWKCRKEMIVTYSKNYQKYQNLLTFQDSSYSDKSVGKYKIAEFPIRKFIPHFFKISLKCDQKYVSNSILDLGSFVFFDVL